MNPDLPTFPTTEHANAGSGDETLRFADVDAHADPAAHAAEFYRSDSYRSDSSVGYMMKRVILSITTQADKRLCDRGLTSAQWGPLMKIQQAGTAPVVELARWMHVDAGAMTRLLDRLERKGLCQRVRCTDDRRVVRVRLTPQGEEAVVGVPEVLCDVLNAHLAGFSADEWQALRSLLGRMLDNGEAMREARDGDA